ncbi:hypothetical protein [Terrabacter sp. NPDC080008]|uniref:hypothetical protein n=1 Tax=Terrabacter sp. NPDC080008 TaxID=3155176 RepID=UPI00344B1015
MSEQIIDLRSVWAILRRHTRGLAVAAVVGAAAGGAALTMVAPEYTSSTLMVFQATPTGTPPPANAHAIDTQVQIALSDAVLAKAGQALQKPLSATQVADRVVVESPTDEVLTITARGETPAQAEQLATAVADADIAYLQTTASGLTNDERSALEDRKTALTESLSAVRGELTKTNNRLRSEVPNSAAAKTDAATLSQLTARQADLVLQVDALERQLTGQSTSTEAAAVPQLVGTASPAQSQPAVVRGALYVGLGAAVALLAYAALVVLRGRREKVLRSRDQIADSIGVTVVASVQSRTPRSVAGWVSLLRGYSPGSSDAWALHQIVQRFGSDAPLGSGAGGAVGPPSAARRTVGRRADDRRTRQLLVLSLAGDQPALALGPQLASFAAATGKQTRLVTTSQRDESTNSLRAACARVGGHEQLRAGLTVDSQHDGTVQAELEVHPVTVSRQDPARDLPRLEGVVTLLAVSSGGATAEDLARVALAADAAGVPLVGLVVTNPDPLDRTTGRLQPAERAVLAPLPSLMTGATDHGDPTVPTATGRKR